MSAGGMSSGGMSAVGGGATGLASDAGVSSDATVATKAMGAACGLSSECASRLCVSMACRLRCDIDQPNDCNEVGGLCVPTTLAGVFFCKAEIKTGRDEDNAVMQVGDSVTRALSTLDDADLFRVKLNRLGVIVMEATPAGPIDLALDMYNGLGEKIGTFNSRGLGFPEAAETTVMTVTGYVFVVVRNVGNSTGSYTLRVR
jgi:hypothetical protein